MNNTVKTIAIAFAALTNATAFAQVGIGTTTPNAKSILHINADTSLTKGFLVTGNASNTATVPDLNEGSRLMFYPGKSAFRAGYVQGSEWNDVSVGRMSAAFGFGTIASGQYSFAMGAGTNAGGNGSFAAGAGTRATGYASAAFGSYATGIGDNSFAIGNYTTATGYNATAMGEGSVASGYASTAIGGYTTASGYASLATGDLTQASGDYSTAMGLYANTNNHKAAFVISDFSSSQLTSSDADNQMMMRFSGGYKLYSDASRSAGNMLAFNTGNLGIGADPLTTYKLYVNTSGNGATLLESNNGIGTWLDLKNTTTGAKTWNIISSGNGNGEGAGNLLFHNDGGTPVIFKSDGTVGIGTTAPSEKLQVDGNIKISTGGLLLPTTGGTASVFNNYEEATASETFFNGPNIYLSGYSIKLLRVGKQVTLTLPVDQLALNVSGVQDIVVSTIPARFVPASNIYLPVRIRNNGVDGMGVLWIRTDGTAWMKPSASGGNWNGTNSGFYATAVTYSVQ